MPFINSVRGSFGSQGRFNRRPISLPTGGTITEAGGYRIHTFTTVGTSAFVTESPVTVQFLIVGGGGQGSNCDGSTGGGGAGGVVYSSGFSLPAGSHTVSVADFSLQRLPDGSGTRPDTGYRGNDSSFYNIVAKGGGGGVGWVQDSTTWDGGCGGGGSGTRTTPGSQTQTSQNGGVSNIQQYGQNGGAGVTWSGGAGSGGGGAGEIGQQPSGQTVNGRGGNGVQFAISGTNTYYAGGGGGGTQFTATDGPGGLGGGGIGRGNNGATPLPRGGDGGANTGGGGGAGTYGPPSAGGRGGSGIVIVRYIPG